MARLSDVTLQGARRCVRPEFTGLSAQQLKDLLDRSLSRYPLETAEAVVDSFGSVLKGLQGAAPGAAQGAAKGAAVGGPYGAAIGAGLGLASAYLGKKKPPSAASAAGASAPPETPALPTGPDAAATFLSLLRNPMVRQALASQSLGAAGNPDVVTRSGTTIPAAAINDLLTQLLGSASEALAESEEDRDDYMRVESGEYVVDPASPDQRASRVLLHIAGPQVAGPPGETGGLNGEWLTVEFAEWDEHWAGVEGTDTVEFY